MSEIKYRINLGNCGNDLNSDFVAPTVIDQIYRADTIILKADTTIYTADYNL